MTLSVLLREVSLDELTLQMAYDTVEAEESRARRMGVKTVSESQAVPASGRISRQDPNWYQKFARLGGVA